MNSIWDASSLRRLRLDAKHSVKSAAEALTVTREYLSMVENGHRSPSQKLIASMARLYDAPITAFLFSENISSEYKQSVDKT